VDVFGTHYTAVATPRANRNFVNSVVQSVILSGAILFLFPLYVFFFCPPPFFRVWGTISRLHWVRAKRCRQIVNSDLLEIGRKSEFAERLSGLGLFAAADD